MDAIEELRPASPADWLEPPQSRWALNHVEELLPTAVIERGTGPVREFAERPVELEAAVLHLDDGPTTVLDFLMDTSTDAFLVLRGDRVVFERYFGEGGRDRRHALFSVSKSLLGTAAGSLVRDGLLGLNATVADYVPELRASAYGSATIRHVLDMTVSINFNHDYLDPRAEVHQMDRAVGWRPRRDHDPVGVRSFLTHLNGNSDHGRRWFYCSATTDVLAWVLERASGSPYAELMSKRLWSRIGAEHDALVTVDALGTPYACAGVNATARDLARFGRCMLQGGVALGQPVVPALWLDLVRGGGDPVTSFDDVLAQEFRSFHPRGSYRNHWWISGDENGRFFALGIHGQCLWLDPARDVVIAKFSSQPIPRMSHRQHDPALAGIAELVGNLSMPDSPPGALEEK